MIRQTRRASFVEAVANVVVGFVVALVTQAVLFPLFGFHAGPVEHGAIATVFTILSLTRSFLLRRLFVHLDARRDRERAASLERRLATGRL